MSAHFKLQTSNFTLQSSFLRRVSILGAAGAIIIASIGLLGYVPGLGLLGSVHEGYIPMAPSTAISFIVLGGILLALTRAALPRAIPMVLIFLAALVSLFGALEVAGHFTGRDLNFEDALVPSAGYLGEIPIARMSPATGAAFLLAGLAVLALVLRRSRSHGRGTRLGHCAGSLGSLVLGIGSLFCLAYLFGSPLLYGRGATIPMALTTALAFLMLGAAAVGASGKDAIPASLLAGVKRASGRMSARGRILLLALIMAGACAVVMVVMTVILYRHEVREHREMLQVTAQSQARLIEAVARYDATMTGLARDKDPDYDASAATLSQILDALERFKGFGETGEFTLARRDGDSIVFVLRHRHDTVERPVPVPFDSGLAEPMRRALEGRSGTIIGLDYRGKTVVAAHEPVAVLNLGIVAKIDLSEVRAPFIRAGFSAVATAILVVLGGMALFLWIGNPIIEQLEAQAQDLKFEVAQRNESEGKLLAFMESATDGFVVYDSDLNLVSINKTALEIYPAGSTEENLRGKHMLEISPGLKETGRYDEYIKVLKTGEPVHFEYTVPDPRFGERDLSVSAFRAGAGLGLIFTDTTKRKLSEQVLRDSEARFKAIYENAPVLINAFDEDGRCMLWNKQCRETFGWTIDEINAHGNALELFYPDPAMREEVMGTVTDTPEGLFREWHPMTRDGRTLTTMWANFRLPGGMVFNLGHDITESRRAEQELEKHRGHLEELVRERTTQLDVRVAESEQLNSAMVNVMEDLRSSNVELGIASRELKVSNQELDAFSYSVSHDLRAPLRHITGFVDLLKESSADELDSTGQRQLNIIAESAKRMGCLIDDLLAFSRAGRVELHKTDLDLEGLVRSAVREVMEQAHDREIDWQIARLPEVHADQATLRQVFVNLFNNAVKYTRESKQARVEVGMVPGEENELVVFVRDNGAGFDMQYVDKLFGVFQRLHSAEEFEGTGVGLANVRRIIHRHGGRTWAEGKVGEGATFYFSLPLEVEEG